MKTTFLRTLAIFFYLFSIHSLKAQTLCPLPSAVYQLTAGELVLNLHAGGSSFAAVGDEVGLRPLGSDAGLIYESGLFIGGITPDAQSQMSVHVLSAEDQTCFGMGPLSESGDTTTENCELWDRFFVIYKQDVEAHHEYFSCLEDPNCDIDDLPDYTIPEAFFDYPAQGNFLNDEAEILFPFYDFDGDGNYNPLYGDAPYFSSIFGGSEDDCCGTLKGDVVVLSINNSKLALQSSLLDYNDSFEIHKMHYAYFSSDPEVAQTVFVQQRIFRRGTTSLSNAYVGHLIDFDIGFYGDDLFTTLIEQNTIVAYNGDDFDETEDGFGDAIPALAIQLIQSPLQDADGLDNDLDGVIDNETLGLTNAINPDGIVTNSFNTDGAVYNAFTSRYANNMPYMEEGVQLDHQWVNYPDLVNNTPPADHRVLMSSGPFTSEPNDVYCLTYAMHYLPAIGQSNPTGPLSPEILLPRLENMKSLGLDCAPCVAPLACISAVSSDDFVVQLENCGSTGEEMWDFGDGASGEGYTSTHQYAEEGSYEVSLVVSNACGQDSTSFMVQAVVLSTSEGSEALTQEDAFSGVEVYPNPAKDSFSWTESSHFQSVELRSLDGRLIQTTPAINAKMSIESLPNGWYLVYFLGEKERAVRQLIIE